MWLGSRWLFKPNPQKCPDHYLQWHHTSAVVNQPEKMCALNNRPDKLFSIFGGTAIQATIHLSQGTSHCFSWISEAFNIISLFSGSTKTTYLVHYLALSSTPSPIVWIYWTILNHPIMLITNANMGMTGMCGIRRHIVSLNNVAWDSYTVSCWTRQVTEATEICHTKRKLSSLVGQHH